MYIKLPLGFHALFLKSEVMDYINKNEESIKNNTIMINLLNINEGPLNIYLSLNNTSLKDSLFIGLFSLKNLLQKIYHNQNIHIKWPNKLYLKNQSLAKCTVYKNKQTQILHISIRKISTPKSIIMRLCEHLSDSIHCLKMLGREKMINEMKNLISKEKEVYYSKNTNLTIKTDNININGDLSIISTNYTTHTLNLEDFICIKQKTNF